MNYFYWNFTRFVCLLFLFYSVSGSADDTETINEIEQNNTSVISANDENIVQESEVDSEVVVEPVVEPDSKVDSKVEVDSSDASDGFTVFQYSIFSPIQLFPENYDVYGLRINALYGENRSIYGVDLGMYSALSQDMYGFQLAGVACSRDGDAFGVSVASIANMSIGDDAGLSVAGFMNLASGEFTGLQIGAVCRAQKFNGVQVGVFNHCDDFKGFQFGLVNICRNQSLPFTVLLNFRF